MRDNSLFYLFLFICLFFGQGTENAVPWNWHRKTIAGHGKPGTAEVSF